MAAFFGGNKHQPNRSLRDQLTIQFQYSPVEHVQALDETPYRRLLRKWWVPGSIAFIAVLSVRPAVRYDVFDSPGKLLLMTVPSLFMLGTMLAVPIVMRRFEIARYRRGRRHSTNDLVTRFDRDGFTPGGDRAQPIPWPMISRVVESDNYYFFYNALSDVPDYLPKRVLTESDARDLEALLHDQFRARSTDLRLRAGVP